MLHGSTSTSVDTEAANGCLFDYSHHLSLITVLVCLQFINHCITQGASKAKLKEDDLTREEIIESIATEVKKNLKEVDGAVDAEMKEAIEHIKQLANNASDNPDAIYVLMSRFTRPNLVKFNNVNGTTDVNNLQKIKTLKSILFSDTLKKFREKEANIKLIEQAMENCTKFIVHSKYLADAGFVQWNIMRADTEKFIKLIDEATGAAAAMERMQQSQRTSVGTIMQLG